MYHASNDLLDGFRASPEVYHALLKGVTQEQAAAAKGGDEGWSVIEVLCHLRDSEEIIMGRMRLMRDSDYPFLAAFDQDALAQNSDYASANLHEAFQGFLDVRRQHLAELEELDMEDWDRPGNHEEGGRITITAQTLHLVAHDLIHAAQIARQLGGGA